LPYASSLCGACREVCPVKIDIPELLLHLRAEIKDGEANGAAVDARPKGKFIERVAFSLFSFAWRRSLLYKFGMVMSRFAMKRSANARLLGKLVPPVAAWTEYRDAPQIAPRSFREIWKTELKSENDD